MKHNLNNLYNDDDEAVEYLQIHEKKSDKKISSEQ